MIKDDPAWLADYLAGLNVIKLELAERLEKAGAKLGSSCFTHPKVSQAEDSPPSRLAMTVVPFNAPKISIDFSAEDLMRSTRAVHPEAAAKVERVVAEFRSFREDPDRYLMAAEARSPRMRMRKVQLAAGGQAPAADSTGKSHNRHRIDIEAAHEVRYWTSVFGVDSETLMNAVQRVGPSVQAVRRHFKDGKHLV